MFTKTNRWIFTLTISLLAVMFSLPVQATAQTVGLSENTCLTCHEDLYYLHDTGCWYCMTEAHKDRCVDCHEGNPTSMEAEVSHLGMLAHPQENDGVKCLECHEQSELASVLNTFDTNGGFDVVIKAESRAPDVAVESGFSKVAEATPMVEWKWVVGASVLFGLWLVLVLFSPLKP